MREGHHLVVPGRRFDPSLRLGRLHRIQEPVALNGTHAAHRFVTPNYRRRRDKAVVLHAAASRNTAVQLDAIYVSSVTTKQRFECKCHRRSACVPRG